MEQELTDKQKELEGVGMLQSLNYNMKVENMPIEIVVQAWRSFDVEIQEAIRSIFYSVFGEHDDTHPGH